MGNFRSGNSNRFGGRNDRSGGSRFGGRDRRGGFGGGRSFGRDRAEMHNVTCSKCGKECQVPFKPTGDKPVYCNDCFKSEGSSRSGSSSGITSEQFNQLNAKLDKILAILDEIVVEDDEDFDEDLEADEAEIEA